MKYYMTTNKRNNYMAPISLFDSFFGDKFFGAGTNSRTMHTDIIDKGDNYSMLIEMPGYDKKNIALDYDNGYLTVSATRDSDAEYLRRESYTSCSRSYYVGDLVESQLKAKYDNGVLIVTLPKEQPAKKSTSISID